ncbi:hypothetical protein HELRODRAFT_73883 [Helobdella robusta]|uniref:RIM zinc finger domain-containing protein n=1 Tax=Helobdella robusta TaxID=6412 RepID=T1G1K0_HELRO|nr:hypothetical protein HELRODRAFT_73883 [Helobdella robusta]ESO09216.1 hypothetical protein HELRODRAFT_73883 [Helobdella robusta]
MPLQQQHQQQIHSTQQHIPLQQQQQIPLQQPQIPLQQPPQISLQQQQRSQQNPVLSLLSQSQEMADTNVCRLCNKTKFADGSGHHCYYCSLKSCAKCGFSLNLLPNKVNK